MNYSEYTQEVIDAICDLEGCSQERAEDLILDKQEQLRHGHKYRLSPSIIAGSVLGIYDCCVAAPTINP